MKMKLGKRLIIFAQWLLSLLLCLLALLNLDFWAFAVPVKEFMQNALIVVLPLSLLAAAAMVAFVFRHTQKREECGFITVNSSETGRTRIAVSAVEQMIRQAVRGVDGILEMKSSITDCGDDIIVDAEVSLRKGVHVPTATLNIQSAVRSYIEQNCGVAVREVRVDVHFVETDEENKKRSWRKAKAAAENAPAVVAVLPESPLEDAEIIAEEPIAEEEAFENAADETAEEAFEDIDEEPAEDFEEALFDDADEPIVLTLNPQSVPVADEASEEPEKDSLSE